MGRAPSQTPWQRGSQALLGLFLASSCPLCDRSSPRSLCPTCERQVYQSQLTDPVDASHPGLLALSWGRYEDSLRQALRHIKYSGHPDLALWLGLEMGKTWRHHQQKTVAKAARPTVLVPIPLHASKLKQRGFNQAERLAQGMGRTVQRPVLGNGLVRVQATQAQHGLGREERKANLAQAFQVHPNHLLALRQQTVWLVDDILTTGATALAAAQTLRQSGISVAGICTAARAGCSSFDPHPPLSKPQ